MRFRGNRYVFPVVDVAIIVLFMVCFLIQPVSAQTEKVQGTISTSCPAILTIRSTPAGAAVMLDGNYAGVTPLEKIRTVVGSHTLKLTLDGYYGMTDTFWLQCDETTIKEYPLIFITPKPEPVTKQPVVAVPAAKEVGGGGPAKYNPVGQNPVPAKAAVNSKVAANSQQGYQKQQPGGQQVVEGGLSGTANQTKTGIVDSFINWLTGLWGMNGTDRIGKVVCSNGETSCYGTCVDLNRDLGNCGSCGTQCGEPDLCFAGECTPNSAIANPNNCPLSSVPACNADEGAVCKVNGILPGEGSTCVKHEDPYDPTSACLQYSSAEQKSCFCQCMKNPPPMAPLRYLDIAFRDDSRGFINFTAMAYDKGVPGHYHDAGLPDGFHSGDKIRIYGGPAGQWDGNIQSATFTNIQDYPADTASKDVSLPFENFPFRTRYSFTIDNGSTFMMAGVFTTPCQIGKSIDGKPDYICNETWGPGGDPTGDYGPYYTQVRNHKIAYYVLDPTNSEHCGNLGELCCDGAIQHPCDHPFGCQQTENAPFTSCRYCSPFAPLPIDGNECKALPTTASHQPNLLTDSNLGGSIDAELMNGLTFSPDSYYWIMQSKIYRVPRGYATLYGPSDPNEEANYQWQTAARPFYDADCYDHFGDGDFYNGILYVPLGHTDDAKCPGKPPVLVIWKPGPNGMQAETWVQMTHGGGSWAAVNPQDGKLYTGGGITSFYELDVYDISQLEDSTGKWVKPNSELPYLGTVMLNYKYPNLPASDSFWNIPWNQGGDFSSNGIFYHVWDNKDNTDYTGVHAFRVLPLKEHMQHQTQKTLLKPDAEEITLAEQDNKGFMHVTIDPTITAPNKDCWKDIFLPGYCEASGTDYTVISRNEELESVSAERTGTKQTTVLLTKLENKKIGNGGEDTITVYYWIVDEP